MQSEKKVWLDVHAAAAAIAAAAAYYPNYTQETYILETAPSQFH